MPSTIFSVLQDVRASIPNEIVFVYINQAFLHAPSRDLSKESLTVLKDLMLAQAQECFIEKVIGQDKKKGNIVAKLASSCAYMYANVLANLVRPDSEISGQFEKSWSELAKVCVLAYNQ